MCYFGTHARANVKTQGLRTFPTRLLKDDTIPEMATDGSSSW